MFDNIRTNITENYGGYETWFVSAYGWIIAAAVIILGVLFSFVKWNKKSFTQSNDGKGVSQ